MQYYSDQFPVVPRTVDYSRSHIFCRGYPKSLPFIVTVHNFDDQRHKDFARGKVYMMTSHHIDSKS